LHPLNHIQTSNLDLLEKNPGSILILQKASWKKAMLLLSVAQNAHLLIRQGERKRFPWFNWVFFSVKLVKSDNTLRPLIQAAGEMADETTNPCILVESEELPKALEDKTSKFIYVDVDTSGKHVNILFEDTPHDL